MKRFLRAACSFLLVCAAVSTFRLAIAAPQGRVTLKTGEVLVGELTEVSKDSHVTMKLATGEVRAIPWTDVDKIEESAPQPTVTAQPTYSPPPTVTAQPTYYPPPQPTYSPPPQPTYYPPPQPTYYPPSYPPPKPPAARSTRSPIDPLFLALRLGWTTISGNAYQESNLKEHVSAGLTFEGQVGLRATPQLGVVTSFEHNFLGKGTQNENAPSNPYSNAIGIGVNYYTNPKSFGWMFEALVGYRWLTASYYPNSELDMSGVNFKISLGLSIGVDDKYRFDFLWGLNLGIFSSFSGCYSDGNGQKYCTEGLPDSQRSPHTLMNFALAFRFN